MQDSGKPEDAGTAEPEGARTGETRESISRRRGREKPGQPGRSNLRPSRKTKRVRRLKASSGGAAGRSGAQGKPRAQAPVAPKNERFGVTRISVAGRAGRCRKRGIPGTCIERRNWKSEAVGKPAADATEVPKDMRVGETRFSVAGRAGRCISRGNPRCIEKRNGRNRIAGQPGIRKPLEALIGVEIQGNLEIERRQNPKMRSAG